MSFRARPDVRRFLAGELASASRDADRLNATIRDASIIRDHIGRNVGGDVTDWTVRLTFFAKVMNNGAVKAKFEDGTEELLKDARYWVQIGVLKNAVALQQFKSDADFDYEAIDEAVEPAFVIATNVAEVPNQSHLLPHEDVVEVFAVESGSTSGKLHYYFHKPPVFAFGVAAQDPTDGVNSIQLNPCLSDTSATLLGLDSYDCAIVSPKDAAPEGMTFKQGAILAFTVSGIREGKLLPIILGGSEDPCANSLTPELHVHSFAGGPNSITYFTQRGCGPIEGPFTLLEMEECPPQAQTASIFEDI